MIRRGLGPLLVAALAGAIPSNAGAQKAQRPEVTVLVPRFDADGELGANITATLDLGVWATLRSRPVPNPENLDFGDGRVLWSMNTSERSIASVSEKIEGDAKIDIVLWGQAKQFGPDLVVTSYLLTRRLEDKDAPSGALWRVTFGETTVSLGTPRDFYALDPVTMDPGLVAKFQNPEALRICDTRTVECDGPPAGNHLVACQSDGNWVLVVTKGPCRDWTPEKGGARGWIYLQDLASRPNTIIAFTGAMVAYFRSDFEQAARMFASVSQSSENPAIAEDAASLSAAAMSRRGEPGAATLIDQIRSENPYSRFPLRVAVMDALQRAANGNMERERLQHLAAELEEKHALFEKEDPWLRDVRTILAGLGIEGSIASQGNH
jgi:hypothetical protein